MPELALKVDGRRLTAWEGFSLSRSLQAVAGAFALEASDRAGFPVPEGARVQLEVEGEPALDGWVDAVRPRFDARERRVAIVGRDRTADLVDCSIVDTPAEFLGLTLDALAAELVRPFGIEVASTAAALSGSGLGAPFERFAIQPGETVFEALERAARFRGALLTTDGSGRLVLDVPAARRAAVELVEGRNVKSGSGAYDRSGRFRRYLVQGQRSGSDLVFADGCRSDGEAFDDAIRANRSTLILAEGWTDLASAQRRAEWEATVRRARGSAVSITVQGWRQAPGGELWSPNSVVRVRCPSLRLDRDLLISGTRLSLDPRAGSIAELELVHPEAFTPQPDLPLETDLAADLADPESF